MNTSEDLTALQVENARLVALLEAHGIEWRLPPYSPPQALAEAEPSKLSTEQKIKLFRRLFRGRADVYPIRWESKSTGKTGYSPACSNEWRTNICEKPRIKCLDCNNRLLSPLSDAVIYDHLAGAHIIGIYPLLVDEACYFLAADFDEAEWREDAKPSLNLAMNSKCRWLWRYPAPAKARMHGYFSKTKFLHVTLAVSVPRSSVILVLVHVN